MQIIRTFKAPHTSACTASRDWSLWKVPNPILGTIVEFHHCKTVSPQLVTLITFQRKLLARRHGTRNLWSLVWIYTVNCRYFVIGPTIIRKVFPHNSTYYLVPSFLAGSLFGSVFGITTSGGLTVLQWWNSTSVPLLGRGAFAILSASD